MSTSKVTISIDENLLQQVDSLVAARIYPNRSQVVQEALQAKLQELKRHNFEVECRKLDPQIEQTLADQGLSSEVDEWPTY